MNEGDDLLEYWDNLPTDEDRRIAMTSHLIGVLWDDAIDEWTGREVGDA